VTSPSSESFVLRGSVAVVTGCARPNGIGRAAAVALARLGADVAVTDLSPTGTRNLHESTERSASEEGLAEACAEIESYGVRALALLGDVSKRADTDRMIAETLDHFGRIDVLVNNAAAPQDRDRGLTWEIPEEAFDSVMKINTKGVFLMSTGVARHLVERKAPGRIVNIDSSGGRRGFAKSGAYCASKFAVIGLTQVMALELAPFGVTVNAVCPGPTVTSRGAGNRQKVAEGIPLGRLGTATDVAGTVAFLASESGAYITGQSWSVDGGLIMS
jgi:3-oxoacyl-[acyl-carrier protein] reductase